MPDVIEQLRNDHANASRLLDLMETQLAMLHEDRISDYSPLQDAMNYMVHYSDVFHHPKEDAVFKKLEERYPSAQTSVNELLEEHKVLTEKGAHFFDCLQSLVSEALIAREDLESQGKDYVEMLRTHMKKEEAHMFPLAIKMLSEEDWAEIDETIESREDPVFGKIIETEYRELYDCLFQSES